MTVTSLVPPRSLFRDREAALANSLVIGWVTCGWLGSFALMGARGGVPNALGVLLCVHTMVLAAYLIHEAAHQTLFAVRWANSLTGEWMNFVAGSAYASFERIRHMHVRHHLDRADLTCFDFKGLLARRPAIRRLLQGLEWAYVPATEVLMHLQVVWRPFFVRSQRRHLPRSAAMLLLRGALLALLGLWSLRALLLYLLAAGLLLHVLNFFDAFHHTFEQYFVAADEPVPVRGRTPAYEQANTYSNLVSTRHGWLNLLILNFGYHNAHHQRASVPWYRLPSFHRQLYGDGHLAVMPMRELLRSWHRNRVRRVSADDYGAPQAGASQAGSPQGDALRRADGFVGAHGVSFLTVV